MKTLDTLSLGQESYIVGIHTDSVALKRRLLDMGLTPKTKVTLSRIAPLGDPIEVCLRGYCLTLRKDDAKCVEIE